MTRIPDVPSDEVAGIVIRAGQLGFSRHRVATALGIGTRGLVSIEQRGATASVSAERPWHGAHPAPGAGRAR